MTTFELKILVSAFNAMKTVTERIKIFVFVQSQGWVLLSGQGHSLDLSSSEKHKVPVK
jgi:hypothetical protein